jgi:hypothetical protein
MFWRCSRWKNIGATITVGGDARCFMEEADGRVKRSMAVPNVVRERARILNALARSEQAGKTRLCLRLRCSLMNRA